MTPDNDVIYKLKQLSGMMDKFIEQRNKCNQSMKNMENDLEKLQVFIKKMSLHIDRSVKNTDSHKKNVQNILNDKTLSGGGDTEIKNTIIDDRDKLNEGIKEQINDSIQERRKFDILFSKKLQKITKNSDLTKRELKEQLNKLNRHYINKYRRFNKDNRLAVKSLFNNKGDDNSKQIIKTAVQKEKEGINRMLTQHIEKYEKEQNEDMVNINELQSEIQKTLQDLHSQTDNMTPSETKISDEEEEQEEKEEEEQEEKEEEETEEPEEPEEESEKPMEKDKPDTTKKTLFDTFTDITGVKLGDKPEDKPQDKDKETNVENEKIKIKEGKEKENKDDESLEDKLKNMLKVGGNLKLKKRKSKSTKTLKRKNKKQKNNAKSRTLKSPIN